MTLFSSKKRTMCHSEIPKNVDTFLMAKPSQIDLEDRARRFRTVLHVGSELGLNFALSTQKIPMNIN